MANTTTITGNLTREPEIRYTREGQATAQLGVAVNRRWQDRSTQEWQEATSFFDVVCWRDLAENVALSLAKGMRVMVTGRLEQRSWETEEGDHRSKVEITADEVGPSLRFATADVQRTRAARRGRGARGERPQLGPRDGRGMSDALVDHLVRSDRRPAPGRDGPRAGPPPNRGGGGGPGTGHDDRGMPSRGAGAPPLRFAGRIDFLKEEVFEICAALALGESLLTRSGFESDAAHLAHVFDVVEGRLACAQPSGVGPPFCS